MYVCTHQKQDSLDLYMYIPATPYILTLSTRSIWLAPLLSRAWNGAMPCLAWTVALDALPLEQRRSSGVKSGDRIECSGFENVPSKYTMSDLISPVVRRTTVPQWIASPGMAHL
ncbi:hypothetical protein P175DRAFT_0233149 [Aspergillus ochraceoroseus IBT 24754]|uniref:Uncharacterized protein n=1 Tax=Aspergillus ochraceoroseus IBT 24754 TaxID=1392256 RepID=A0A2T5LWY2_9EURO|nr:uncharacterized protein P175DRAFT_0233149 [Aspergillus ochraceoroseus IBT 24754]PTU20796.1 hypothetical protein P175DRAFT_0233149 [Aspergillus ochraceoroseus IBT 24754]